MTEKEPSEVRSTKWMLILLLAVFAISLVSMPRWHYRGDALRSRVASVNLINYGDISISTDNATAKSAGARGQYYFENVEKGVWYSKYGIMNTLMFVPPLLVEKILRGWHLDYTHFSPERRLLMSFYNVLLTIGVAAYLYSLLGFYSKRGLTKVIYVLAAFYGTFMWNYLRAPSFEIFQMLFFAGFFYHLTAFRHRAGTHKGIWDRNLLLSAMFLACLCLAKLLYVLLIPIYCIFAFGAGFGCGEEPVSFVKNRLKESWKLYVCSAAVPVALLCLVVLAVNNYKFGSPFNTGYRQWSSNADLFGGSITGALSAFFLEFHTNTFLHFPLFAFALPGLIFFVPRHRWDSLLGGSIFVVLLAAISMFPDPTGSWSYGPRYLVVMLPVISIPFVTIIDRAIDRAAPAARLWRTAGAASLLVLVFSAYLQEGVNSMEFFTYFEARGMLEDFYPALPAEAREDIADYFDHTHPGTINRQITDYRQDGSGWPPMDLALPLLEPEVRGALEFYMRTRVTDPVYDNYYLFDEPAAAAGP